VYIALDDDDAGIMCKFAMHPIFCNITTATSSSNNNNNRFSIYNIQSTNAVISISGLCRQVVNP
jgi:hypothetical protein